MEGGGEEKVLLMQHPLHAETLVYARRMPSMYIVLYRGNVKWGKTEAV